MRSFDVTVDVDELAGLAGPLMTVSTVHVPDRIDGAVTALFGFPGGDFGRKYYDVQDRLTAFSRS